MSLSDLVNDLDIDVCKEVKFKRFDSDTISFEVEEIINRSSIGRITTNNTSTASNNSAVSAVSQPLEGSDVDQDEVENIVQYLMRNHLYDIFKEHELYNKNKRKVSPTA